MIYRPATLKDATGIAKVFLSWRNMKTLTEAKKTFRLEFKAGGRFIVAIDKDQIVGLVTTLLHGRPKLGLAELDHIAILPEFQGQGIAQQLMANAIADLQQYYQTHNSQLRKLYLLTHDDNLKAHAFYQKLGFSQEAVLKNHFYNGINEIVYSQFFD